MIGKITLKCFMMDRSRHRWDLPGSVVPSHEGLRELGDRSRTYVEAIVGTKPRPRSRQPSEGTGPGKLPQQVSDKPR